MRVKVLAVFCTFFMRRRRSVLPSRDLKEYGCELQQRNRQCSDKGALGCTHAKKTICATYMPLGISTCASFSVQ